MGAGFSRLNCLTVLQTSQGLAEYLLQEDSGSAAAGVVIGYDARHNSKKFADCAATIFTTKGFTVWWFEDFVHTPLVPFSVQHLKAAAGIMITASHNPAQDNGYKVYGSNGCQINSPIDTHIAAAILQNLEPIAWDTSETSTRKMPILARMKSKYIAEVTREFVGLPKDVEHYLDFVYTPMHGVGLEYFKDVLNKVKLGDRMTVVKQQAQPNPNFPTVRYPNPEEHGALDLAKSTADKNGIRLILANDPDGDRFAAAEKTDWGWHQFTGDQVGILLAYYLLLEKSLSFDHRNVMLTSAVSSQMLHAIGSHEGFCVLETLTGFKWLGNTVLGMRKSGSKVHFAYEEALGYMVPDLVLDKDGIVAAIIFLNVCVKWRSPYAMLQQLYKKYGYFVTMNTYWKSPNIETTEKVFATVRSLGDPFPAAVGSRKILRWRDLTLGFDSEPADHVPLLPSSKSSQMITCWLSGTSHDQGVRFTIRASGTEPKIKSQNLECTGLICFQLTYYSLPGVSERLP